MTYQIARRNMRTLRDAHVCRNPVTGLYEKTIALDRKVKHWSSVAGGTGQHALVFATDAASNIAAPDGTNTAYQIQNTANNATHGFTISATANLGAPGVIDVGDQFAMGVYLKAGTITKVDVVQGGSASVTARFNLATGAKISGDARFRIEPAAGDDPAVAGWYRIFSDNLVYDNATITLTTSVRFLRESDGAASYLGSVGENYYYWLCTLDGEKPLTGLQPFGFNTSGNNGTDALYLEVGGEETLIIPLRTLATPQAMTVYLEWFDRGNGEAVTPPGIFRIGDMNATAANSVEVTQTATGFSGTYNNGGATSLSTVALVPAYGDLVSLRAVLDLTGALQLFASKNGAAEVAGTVGTARAFPASWSEALLIVNSLGGTAYGDMYLRSARAFVGIVSQAITHGAIGTP